VAVNRAKPPGPASGSGPPNGRAALHPVRGNGAMVCATQAEGTPQVQPPQAQPLARRAQGRAEK